MSQTQSTPPSLIFPILSIPILTGQCIGAPNLDVESARDAVLHEAMQVEVGGGHVGRQVAQVVQPLPTPPIHVPWRRQKQA